MAWRRFSFTVASCVDHLFDVLAIDADERRRHQFLAEVAELLEQRPGLRRSKKLGAAVARDPDGVRSGRTRKAGRAAGSA